MRDTITETMQDESFFIPSEDGTTETKYTPKVAGEYLGHITNLTETVREFTSNGKNLKARKCPNLLSKKIGGRPSVSTSHGSPGRDILMGDNGSSL